MFPTFFRKTASPTLSLDGVRAILFDLDGTLVNVDMQRFVTGYLRRLTNRMSSQVDPIRAGDALFQAVDAMFANGDTDKTLEQVLFEVLEEKLSMTSGEYNGYLETFCREDLRELSDLVKGHPLSARLVEATKERGWQVILATNPIFPRAVVDARLDWGGLSADMFHHVTSYETSHFCKPNPAFYEEILARLDLAADACLMVGNDVLHDLSASRIGIRTCLLTPWKVDHSGVSFKADWSGSHGDLLCLLDHGA